MTNVKILVAGAGGRMGRAIVREVLRTPSALIAGGFDRPDGENIGKDIGVLAGLDAIGHTVAPSPDGLLDSADVVIDFTAPQASVNLAGACGSAKTAHVIGTTGFDPAQEEALKNCATTGAIVKSGNMSLGVNLLLALVEQAAKSLGDDYDIEINEAHHRFKVDSPSGTALMLGKAAAQGRGVSLDDAGTGMSEGRAGERKPGDIGFSVVRGGGIIGHHAVHFAGQDEVITLSHDAIDRSLFAKGAVSAALWAARAQPGLYSMRDVLGLN